MRDNNPVEKIGHLWATLTGAVDYALCIWERTEPLKSWTENVSNGCVYATEGSLIIYQRYYLRFSGKLHTHTHSSTRAHTHSLKPSSFFWKWNFSAVLTNFRSKQSALYFIADYIQTSFFLGLWSAAPLKCSSIKMFMEWKVIDEEWMCTFTTSS